MPKLGITEIPYKAGQGYLEIYYPNHPFSGNRSRLLHHRFVWEKHNKAILLPWGDVHHKNKITTDNRPENLEAMMHGQHTVITQKRDYSDRRCGSCRSSNTIIEKHIRIKTPHWRRNPDNKLEWLCHNCYQKWRKKHKISRDPHDYVDKRDIPPPRR